MLLALAGWQPVPEPLPPTGGGFVWALFQTLVALGVVCATAYVTLRVVLPKLGGIGVRRPLGLVNVVDVLPLEPRRTLYVIEVNGKYLLVGASEAGIHVIETLDATTVEKALAARETARPLPPFAQTVERWFMRK
ncbi:MAG: flagellar biosynthetic protein FliO [Chloracidobacterium sp.]|uniref:Flagellar biosynthetic protein FliO n=1 Tax=Chloracidobacterium validum TaxID=2821543 RepID=A0ABX8BCP6_9BACT|nr:flagellar biosynthetic protein FliO [Chloracidobacterium validum]QUW04691.1 flagellar biosynthetic protein FliO [Chloracidobacterium validum]